MDSGAQKQRTDHVLIRSECQDMHADIVPLAGEVLVGLYEKALPAEWSWEQRLAAAAWAGYRYTEVSIDETDGRLARLEDAGAAKAIRRAIENTGVPLLTMCLSAHRRFPLGSADPAIRERGYEIMRRAIDFSVLRRRAHRTGGRLRRVLRTAHGRHGEPLHRRACTCATEWASQAGVMLALENVDVPVSASLHDSMKLVNEMASPWFQIYPDMANVAAEGFDPCAELALCAGHLAAVHVKDGQPKVVRGVPFGTGIVPFEEVFRTLQRNRLLRPDDRRDVGTVLCGPA